MRSIVEGERRRPSPGLDLRLCLDDGLAPVIGALLAALLCHYVLGFEPGFETRNDVLTNLSVAREPLNISWRPVEDIPEGGFSYFISEGGAVADLEIDHCHWHPNARCDHRISHLPNFGQCGLETAAMHHRLVGKYRRELADVDWEVARSLGHILRGNNANSQRNASIQRRGDTSVGYENVNGALVFGFTQALAMPFVTSTFSHGLS